MYNIMAAIPFKAVLPVPKFKTKPSRPYNFRIAINK